METKTLSIEECELKFDDEEWKVEGYASVFNSVDKVGDTIKPGAFTKAITDGREIRMHLQHLPWTYPGKWVKFEQDDYGLKATGYLTRGHSMAQDIRASLRHGTIGGLSIGFANSGTGITKTANGREIHEADLREVSFTGLPAEPKAVVTAWKSELAGVSTLREFEQFLRDSGIDITNSMATALTSHLKSLILRESEQQDAEERTRIQKAAAERLEQLAMKTRLTLFNDLRNLK